MRRSSECSCTSDLSAACLPPSLRREPWLLGPRKHHSDLMPFRHLGTRKIPLQNGSIQEFTCGPRYVILEVKN